MAIIKVKICGLTGEAAVKTAVDNGADYIGFVFFSASPRNVTPSQAEKISKSIPSKTKKVAVVVDHDDKSLAEIISKLKPDYIQLHGSETLERAKNIKAKFGIKIIKAVKVRSSDDVARGQAFQDIADMLLFDARPSDSMPEALPGGNGMSFDWQLLKGREFSVPWILSGGLNSNNVAESIRITGAKIVDVSSSLEIRPGIKEPSLIKEFLNKVSNIK